MVSVIFVQTFVLSVFLLQMIVGNAILQAFSNLFTLSPTSHV